MQTFDFLKYIKPVWYYNLIPPIDGDKATCYYDSQKTSLPALSEELIIQEKSYLSESAIDLDIGFQAWNRGIMLEANEIPERKKEITVEDNYRFIRRYFKSYWPLYILIIRLLSFKNSFVEIMAFIKSVKVRKTSLFEPHNEHESYSEYKSKLGSETKVSVIIPTLNRYKYLKDVLHDLELQTVIPYEVIIVDQSDDADRNLYNQFDLPLKIIIQTDKGQWLARNEAIKQSKCDFLLFFDDDSRVEADWIEQHLKCIDYFRADISAGVSISTMGAKVPQNYSYFRWADQFDSGNSLVRKEVFEKTGMFDRQYDKMRMGDGEFGLRAYLGGFRSVSNPYAKRIHLKVGVGGLRQMGSWDAFRPKKFFAPRPVPSVLYLYRKYYPKVNVRLALFQQIMFSLSPYRHKDNRLYMLLSFLYSVILSPVILIQVVISWNRSSNMLKEGHKIEYI